jgi:hypothetical protein
VGRQAKRWGGGRQEIDSHRDTLDSQGWISWPSQTYRASDYLTGEDEQKPVFEHYGDTIMDPGFSFEREFKTKYKISPNLLSPLKGSDLVFNSI